jgi:hypothetical protein
MADGRKAEAGCKDEVGAERHGLSFLENLGVADQAVSP